MPSLKYLFPIAISVAAAGCGWPYTSGGSGGSSGTSSGTAATPQGDPPVLQAANMTSAVAPNNGVYTIFGSFTWTCDDDVVDVVRFYVPIVAKNYDVPAGDIATAYGLTYSFQLPDDVPFNGAGDTNYEITLITKGGVQSTPPQLETVTLQ